MREVDIERSRESVGRLPKYEIKFLGKFRNGMKWNDNTLLDLKIGIYHMVDMTKTSIHIVPVGGSMWDKFSVPKNKMKVIRRIK